MRGSKFVRFDISIKDTGVLIEALVFYVSVLIIFFWGGV